MKRMVDRSDEASNSRAISSTTIERGLGYELLSFLFFLIPIAIANGMVVVKAAALPLYGAKIILFVLPVSYLIFQFWKKSLAVKFVTCLFAILAGAETFVAFQFGGISGSSLFSILLSSDFSESLNYAWERGLWILCWLCLCGVITVTAVFLSRRSHFSPNGIWILCLLCIAGYGWYLGAMSANLYLKEKNANKFPTVSQDANEKLFGVGYLPPLLSTIKDTFPYGLPIRFWMFLQEEKFMRSMENQIRMFKFGATVSGQRAPRETYVLILGESARYDRWAVNGYDKDTSPNLVAAQQRGELASMRDMVTARTFTMGSIPIYLTGRDTMREGATQKSLISAFKEAGFRTYFLSTQVKKSFLNNVTSLFANEADVQQYFESDDSVGSVYDDALLSPLRLILHDAHPKKLIVLHTMGSHAIYAARYPKKFEKFQPARAAKQIGFEDPFGSIEDISNAYDNSIRFTDYLLGAVMQELRDIDGYAAMVYGSDHGETLPNTQCKSIGHGVTNMQTLHVPYFVWINQAYRAANSGAWNKLLQNQEKSSMTTSSFATVLDLAGIRYAGFPEEESLLREFKSKGRRIVLDMQNTEIDLAGASTKMGACGVLKAEK